MVDDWGNPTHRAVVLVRDVFRDRRFTLRIGFLCITLVAVPALLAYLLSSQGPEFLWLEGFIAGLSLGIFVLVVLYLALVATGGNNFLVGGMAEAWTAQEFSKLGPRWRIFRNVPIVISRGGKARTVDVDLVAVGPYGVVVVEVKFTTAAVDLKRDGPRAQIKSARDQARRNQDDIKSLLQHSGCEDAPVVPVVVFWGPLVIKSEEPIERFDDVRLVAGGDADRWLPMLNELARWTDEEANHVVKVLEGYIGSNQPSTV